jgi:hypothetical protein
MVLFARLVYVHLNRVLVRGNQDPGCWDLYLRVLLVSSIFFGLFVCLHWVVG